MGGWLDIWSDQPWGGNSSMKRTGVLVGNFEKETLRDAKILFCVQIGLKGTKSETNFKVSWFLNISFHFFWLNTCTINGTAKASGMDHLRLNTQRETKKWLILREILRQFWGQVSLKMIAEKQPILCHFLGIFHWKVIGFSLIWWMFLTKKWQLYHFFRKLWVLAYAIATTYTRCLCWTNDFAGKFEHLIWTIVRVCICLTARFFLTEIIICSWPLYSVFCNIDVRCEVYMR